MKTTRSAGRAKVAYMQKGSEQEEGLKRAAEESKQESLKILRSSLKTSGLGK